MESFAFGGEEAERVEVQVHGYEREPVGEYYDDNWVRVSVHVNVGSFSGLFDATFLTSELAEFRVSVSSLYESLVGVARFTTLEDQLSLELAGDGRGHIQLKGVAIDAPGIGNRLEFQMALDQGHLSAALRGLDGIASSFPVRAV
ncbi:hypothetical protein AO741_20765 [Pseudomonas sp. TTU2014-105ASC]|nr:hypothetical protein AO741_20765 [Pseudomonas sp. TTU2014-105ASC]